MDFQRLYEEEKRLREQAEQRADAEERRAEEEKRRAEEEKRRAEEEKRRAEEEKRLRLVEVERRRQDDHDSKSVISILRREIKEYRETIQPQALQPYLAQISRLHLHLSRLIPLPRPRQSKSITSESRTRVTTSGRTTIHGKYYPLHLRAWSDFPDLQSAAFSRIYTVLDNSRRQLPSRQQVQQDEERLLNIIDLNALQTEWFLHAGRTSQFLDAALETPASHILKQYLAASGQNTRLLFDNVSAGLRAKNTPYSSPNVSGGNGSGNRSGNNSDSNGSDNSHSSQDSALKAPVKTQPDCVILALPASEEVNNEDESLPKSRRIAVGEHKSCHELRAAEVAKIIQGPLAEDYVVRLAREALRRRGRSQSGKAAASSSNADTDSGSDASTKSVRVPKQAYLTYALAQTYHYMLLSGLEFGYLATGETLVLLRIPEDDPTTLLYHRCGYPAATPQDRSSYAPSGATKPASLATDPVTEADLAKLSIAQLCSLCMLALSSPLRPDAWIARALSDVAVFPNLPPSVAALRPESPSSLGRRARGEDDDDSTDDARGDDNDDDNGGSGGGRGGVRRRLLRPPESGGSKVRTPSPLQQEYTTTGHTHAALPSWRDIPVSKPTLPYCTQACLLGLANNRELDANCPNYRLHKDVATASDLTPGLSPGPGQESRHAITQDQFAELVKEQLLRAPGADCEGLSKYGCRGAIGWLFKITLSGFGYTFVAKAVERHHYRRLKHEKHIYAGLQAQQGVLIPVFLGLIKLAVPYPLPVKFTVLPYMLLMSYAGEPVAFSRTPEDDVVEYSQEVNRTLQDLEDLGLYDSDDNEANVTWCEDTKRAMKIDFDRAHLVIPSHQVSPGPPTPASAAPGVAAAPGALRLSGLATHKRRLSTEKLEELSTPAVKRVQVDENKVTTNCMFDEAKLM